MSGLYIHLPFCVNKCPYCGFHSIAKAGDDIIAQYLQALHLELQFLSDMQLDTIYIGGGTPSHLGMRLISFIEAMLPLIHYSGAEFTVEVNPESVSAINHAGSAINHANSAEFCRALATLPVTRISMGVQSLDDGTLQLLGRAHSAKQAQQAYEQLRHSTKAAINMDLMYDIPQVPASNIASSLQGLIKLAPEHISAYSYSPDTGYLATEPSRDPYQTEMVTDMLQAAGYLRYELSNYALAGHEAKHNLKYWQMQPYIGIGASAHSMIYDADGAHLRWQHGKLEAYLQDPLRRDELEQYNKEDSLKEALVFGLRQVAGVDLAELSRRYGCNMPADLLSKITALSKQDILIREGEQLRASAKGLLLLNLVMEYLW